MNIRNMCICGVVSKITKLPKKNYTVRIAFAATMASLLSLWACKPVTRESDIMSATGGSRVDSVDGLLEFCRSVELDDVDIANMQNNWNDENWNDFNFLVENSSNGTGPDCPQQSNGSMSLSAQGDAVKFLFLKREILLQGAQGIIKKVRRVPTDKSSVRTVFWDLDDTLGTSVSGAFHFKHGASELMHSLAKSKIKVGFFSDSPLSRIASILQNLNVTIGGINKSILRFVSGKRIYSNEQIIVEGGRRVKVFNRSAEEMKNIVLIDDTRDILRSNQAISHLQMRIDYEYSGKDFSYAQKWYEQKRLMLNNKDVPADEVQESLEIMRNIYLDQNRLVLYRGVIEKAEQVANSKGIAFNRAAHDITAKVLTDGNHAYTDQIMDLGLTMLRKVNASFSLAIPKP